MKHAETGTIKTVKGVLGVTANINVAWSQMVQEQLNSLKVPPAMMGADMGQMPRPLSLPRDNDLLRLYDEAQHIERIRRWKTRAFCALILACIILSPVSVSMPAVWAGISNGLLIYLACRLYGARKQNRPESPARRPVVPDRYVWNRVQTGGTERIGDAERDTVCEELAIHFSAGRLKEDEFTERMERATEAVTGDDLTATLTDLPMLTAQERIR